jgi:hypothetical protein
MFYYLNDDSENLEEGIRIEARIWDYPSFRYINTYSHVIG